MGVPSASVLIPVYNGEPFLAECLDSVLAQDIPDFEVLIGDDASNDGSAALIERYAQRDSRIRWWKNPRNLGIGGNWNACLRAATGEFVKYLLQDDKLLRPDALRRQMEVLRGDASISLVASASTRINAQSQPAWTRDCFGKSGTWDGHEIILRCFEANENIIGEPSLALFRREQAQRGFDERMVQLLDLEMWFHLLEQGRFAYIAEPLCAFRLHPAQATEVNWRTNAAASDALLLAEAYYNRPWMRAQARPRPLFSIMYNLRKKYGARAEPLCAELKTRISPPAYAACWLRYKALRPFKNLRTWLQKRQLA